MRKLHVVCPLCSKYKRIAIPPEIFEIDEGSLLKLPVRKGQVCEHEFLVVLDYNFSVRDYEVPNPKNNLRQYFDRQKMMESFDFSYF